MIHSDSGLIDLIAIDRDARAQNALLAHQGAVDQSDIDTPSALPVLCEVRSESLSDDEVDRFAASMSSPWKRLSRAKLAVGALLVVVVLGAVAVVKSGADASNQGAAAPRAAEVPASPPRTFPSPPVEPAKPQLTPSGAAPTVAASANAPAAKPDKSRRLTAPAGKARSRGPELTKVTSSGIAP